MSILVPPNVIWSRENERPFMGHKELNRGGVSRAEFARTLVRRTSCNNELGER